MVNLESIYRGRSTILPSGRMIGECIKCSNMDSFNTFLNGKRGSEGTMEAVKSGCYTERWLYFVCHLFAEEQVRYTCQDVLIRCALVNIVV